ncbi:VOC family protein [Paenibacillus koleovorans]
MSTPLVRVSPCLWFESQVEEAARYYVSIFQRRRDV